MATVFTFRRTERIEQGIRLEPLPQHDPLEEETARSVGTVSNDLLMLAASLHDTLTAADAIASAADLLVQSADDLETIPSQPYKHIFDQSPLSHCTTPELQPWKCFWMSDYSLKL